MVGVVHDTVAEPVVPACTVIVKGAREATFVPSLTEIDMFASVPMSEVAGVPVSWPDAVLKDAHAGLFAIENVRVAPVGLDAVGVNV